MTEDKKVVVLADRAPRNQDGYADPPQSFADELIHPPAPGVPVATPPQPARDNNPRLVRPLCQTIYVVPAGTLSRSHWRSRKDKTWSAWSERAGPCTIRVPLMCDLSECQTWPAGTEFEAAPA